MERIKIQPVKIVKTRETERGQLLAYFRGKINAGRKGTTYKPVSMAWTATKLTGLKLADLYYMQSVMKDLDQKGPGHAVKWFYWSLRHQYGKGNN